jgi:hypothetical protein
VVWVGYYVIWIAGGFMSYSFVEPESFPGVIGFLFVWAIVGLIGTLLWGALLGAIARANTSE